MNKPARFHRSITAISFVAAAALMVVSVLLQPEFPDSATERLAAIDAGGASSVISALTFTSAQLPFIVAMLGAAQLLRTRSPIMSILTGSFGLIGGFGHAIFGGISITTLVMAADAANHDLYAAVLARVENGPAVIFMIMGLLGTVLGVLFLAIGIWRARLGQRWLFFVLLAFLVIEFVGTSFSEWASLVSALLFLLACTVLAVMVWRSTVEVWSTNAASTATAPVDATLS